MRKTPILAASLFLVGSFVVAQGCGGSTTEDLAGPKVVGGAAGATAGGSGGASQAGASQGGTSQAGASQGGSSGGTAGGASQGGSAQGGSTAGGKAGAPGGSAGKGTGGVDLFDASIPDADLGDGQTASGCYECTKQQCDSELEACAQDSKCGPAAACVLTDCLDNPGITCVGQCGFAAGITSLNDPALGLVTAVAQCTSQKCPNDCPSFGLGQGGSGQGGSGQGGSSPVAGSGGTSSGGGAGASAATCQQNIASCGQSCLSQGVACYQNPTCSGCIQAIQGGGQPSADCASNAQFKGLIDCACSKPQQCAGCCFAL
ncbi:MAG: hypothetical protein IT374_07680 [Polyangiaceae bacterium]|nr:hypothetical protein [Polyangiaceae bacterium]